MNEKVATALKGFHLMSEADRKEFAKQVDEYEKYPHLTMKAARDTLGESQFSKLGPSPNSCPCCGK